MVQSKIQQLITQLTTVTDSVIQRKIDTNVQIEFPSEICNELQVDSDSLNTILFSEKEYSLEIFIRLRIIEKVKELLVYTDLSITEIAAALGYKSPLSLSRYLKMYTGFSSSHFKQIGRDKLAIIKTQSQNKTD